MTVTKSRNEIPTIDVALVTVKTDKGEFAFETANEIEVEPQLNETDAVTLMIKGKLKAQKPKTSTLTSNEITLTDNVFNPELVVVLQGGKIDYDASTGAFLKYTAPIQGTNDTGQNFELNAYSAQYNAAGQIVAYEKITYPNCKGQPVAFGSTDDEFRAPEYTITSAPSEGQAPYVIEMIPSLPTLTDPQTLSASNQSANNQSNTKQQAAQSTTK